MRFIMLTSLALLSIDAAGAAEPAGFALKPVSFTDVHFADKFWLPRLETNRTVTVPACFRKCEETGRIDNFAKAAGLMQGKFRGIYFDDSDVYKAIEGAAYTLAVAKDPKLDKYLDELIAEIAAAQQPDGYLNTYHTLVAPEKRWTNIRDMHEMYCAGHLMEAAVAHFQATGKRSLLDVATKLADHIDSVFGPGRRRDPCGHEEIELALVKLYRATGEDRYLKLAAFFIDQRGRADGHKLYGQYAQDHIPVAQQTEPVGHSVRAGYLYTGMADVAALAGDPGGYVAALDRIWEHLVSRKLYLTGGMGAEAGHEGFGPDYQLPNASAYNETCAAIANALWNQRMTLLHADAKYADLLELVAYNGFLSGVGLGGDVYFYPNPLAFDGTSRFNMGSCRRSPWFDCACCPVNIVRFLPSLPGYAYAIGRDAVYVNLYVGSTATVKLGEQPIKIEQQTDYPWNGSIKLKVDPPAPKKFALHLRIPGWTRNMPVPSDLYRALGDSPSPTLNVNGKSTPFELQHGYAAIERQWQAGDVVELDLPMPVRRIVAHDNVKDDASRVALMRGPIVYCVEAADHGGHVSNLVLPDAAPLNAEHRGDLLGGVTVLVGKAQAASRAKDGRSIALAPVPFSAVPYYAWNHREQGEMAVWMARSPD